MKGKLNKTWKVVLSAFILLTSFGAPTISAVEQFDIRSEVTYGEDNKNAVISLDLTSIDEEYTVESIKDPDGNAMDLTDLNYNVLENGTYDFYVSYFDGTNKKYEYTKTVTVDGVKTVDRSDLARAVTDYTADVVVEDWDILDSNELPLSTTNQATPGYNYQLKVDWSLSTTGGAVLHENDTFTIASLPTNQTSGYWAMSNSDWEVFTDENDIEIGEWRINASKIEVRLNENAEGKQYIEGTFITGESALYNGTMLGVTQNVIIGTIPKNITFKQYTLYPISPNNSKVATLPSNSTIRWLISLNNEKIFELTQQPLGQNFTMIEDMYLEDTLSGKFDGNFIVSYTIAAPFDLTSGAAASATAREFAITSYFTRVYQTSGQSYDDFKNSLNPLEWGVYEDSNGIHTVVVYFGDIGDNGLRYSDIDPNFATIAANACISNGYYAESDRAALVQYFTDVYGDGNVINGHVVKYMVRIGESYDKVIVDTEKTNTAIVTKGGNESSLTGKGTLQGISGSVATVDASKARVWLTDVDTVDFLNGVSMKLQRHDGINWVDYNGWSGDTISTNGYVDTTAIGDGTYRFVQQDAYSSEYDLPNSDGYDTGLGKVVSEEFTISSTEPEGKTVYMTNVKYKYDVVYDPGTQGTFSIITHNNVVINTATPAYSGAVASDGKPSGNAGYTFTGWSPVVSSTVTEDITYVAQWSANTDIAYKVEHYLEQSDGSYVLQDTESLTGTTGHTVVAVAKTYTGYKLDTAHVDTIGAGIIAGDGFLVLRLYYGLDDVDYKVEHYLEQKDGSFQLDSSDLFIATAGSNVSATVKTYTTHKHDATHSLTVESGVVAHDGSLVLRLYYVLEKNPSVAPTEATYKVEYYLEQSDGSYVLKESDTIAGTIGASVNADAKVFVGYKLDKTISETIESGIVLADSSLTLRLYYTKQELELTQKPSIAGDNSNNAVSTSDTTNINTYIGLMFLSLMGLLMMLKKHNKEINS
ncbi:hypothetical protein [Breznakia pachnodae]|uniref:Repeat protein (TIGR02543 family) n=1 Tax=Breznakia pachnodae TaxID=265178 RepID=A0ABU0DZR7_9FIRM|nr:hypothetical protein [Breznakia pachnodae]MDQ0360129.1 hypothetical protein [Breznakia pachnodae]